MIKQIWFDLGNVLVPIDPAQTKDAWERCGVQMEENEFEKLHHAYEMGNVSEAKFLDELTFSCSLLQSNRCVKTGWNALLGDLEDQVLLLKKLGKKYKLAMVSNTNETHIAELRKKSGPFLWNRTVEQFDELFFSFQMGMRKPNKKYFEAVLEKMGGKPEEVLYIDDCPNNLESAGKLGIKTWQFNTNEGELGKLTSVLTKFN